MCLILCDVTIGTAQSGVSGVHGWPGYHRRNRKQKPDRDRLRWETGHTGRSTGCAEEGGTVYRTRGHGTEGVWQPGTVNRITESDYGPANTTVPASGLRSFDIRATAGDIEAGVGRSQEDPENGGNRPGPTTGTGRYDTRRQTIGRWSPTIDDTVSQRAILSGNGSPDSTPAIRRPTTEVCRLPGLLRIRSNSVERLDCSTPDGHTMQTCQFPRQTVEDAVRILPPEGSSFRPDFATRPGGQGDRAGRPTTLYTTPGSSFWGPRPSSHRRTENAGD